MRESYCGLCNECHIGDLEFLETVTLMKEYIERFRANYWSHCFPNEEGFNFCRISQGLEMALNPYRMPGVQTGPGDGRLPDPQLRPEPQNRKLLRMPRSDNHVTNFTYLEVEFPDVKIKLLRRQMKYKASEHNRRFGVKTHKNSKS